MNERIATMDVVALGSGAAAIAISGDVTAACEQDLMAAHEQATDDGAKTIVLDFHGMDYMNSGGIGMLVTLLVRGQRRQQRIAAVGLTEHYRQIFQLTRLDEAILLFDSTDQALAGTAG
ncbi:STAS domain-containing protein [Microbacterium sp. ASV49]|uniref:STAS domain-containing protein n=1 Tax=Microbacterium candidum TaxID=3041922 RepID=A0ABT7N2C1_9MICO|nr:STAS domain-containing protein [Microbacterium sp. ASV49]MDL9980862.1 STAS domain-containing protein [Microbacterium sp. ASV49]